jgi:hypothetical protein
MDVRPSTLPDTREILRLARRDKAAAEQAVAELSIDAQVALVCASPLALRSRILELTPEPEAVIPRMPEAELCFTVQAVGLWDADWILEHATEVQIVASLDLDGWAGPLPDRENLRTWLAALAHAGDATLLRTARSIDTELLVLMLRDRVHVMLDPKDEEWQPPEGARTLDGQFYLLPTQTSDDIADLIQMLSALFQEDYWLYFRLLQGAIWELESDLQEWASRWRNGRLEDLGFPSWEEAMRIYGHLRASDRDRIPDAPRPLDVHEWRLPVFMPELPEALQETHSIFRAAAELDDEQRRGFFYAFVATANKLAIADALPLGDADTLPGTIETAACVLSEGLEHLATVNRLSLPEVLTRVSLERLFRVGASLAGRQPRTSQQSASPEDPESEQTEAPNGS